MAQAQRDTNTGRFVSRAPAGYEGYHQFLSEEMTPYGSFQVFYEEGQGSSLDVGFYWWACFPGCLPDGEPNGPFASAKEAYDDAMEG